MLAHLTLPENQLSLHRSDKDLQTIFNECFLKDYHTTLIGNASEPLYTPASTSAQAHTIFYRHDYFSSALHEVAHWCIAGKQRRKQIDYGYWYTPDGRSSEQQHVFEAVEAKPQAIEGAFSMACGIRFNVSIDNLGALDATEQSVQFEQQKRFSDAVRAQLAAYIEHGFPKRAQMFLSKLHIFYQTAADIKANDL